MGTPDVQTATTSGQNAPNGSSSMTGHQDGRREETTPLIKFQNVVGISTPEALRVKTRPATNRGIYEEIASTEKRRMMQYYACAALINTCIFLQIVFAATLTALGASSSPHDVITVFGAINTAIAGILALMKGQGLPNRLRQDWMELRKVRDYIEERERGFEEGERLLTVDEEIETIWNMYKKVMQTLEDNRPDSYVHSVKPPEQPITDQTPEGHVDTSRKFTNSANL